MYCTNCGAKINKHTISCPYCHATNLYGAEQSYMQKLHDIKDDTAHISEDMKQASAAGFRSNLRHAVRIFLIVGGVSCLIAGLYFADVYIMEKKHEKYTSEIIAFESEYFPILDEMYEHDSLENIIDFVNTLWDIPGSSGIFHWKHHPELDAIYLEEET